MIFIYIYNIVYVVNIVTITIIIVCIIKSLYIYILPVIFKDS